MLKRKLLAAAVLLAVACALRAGYAGYYETGVSAYMHRNYPKAKENLLKAVEASPNGTAYYFLGEIERNDGNYDLATSYYQKAVQSRISPKILRLAYWNLIIMTEKRGNYTELVKSLKIFWESTGSVGARDKAETIINKSIWSDNAEAVACYNKGNELKKNSPDEAMKEYGRAVSIDSNFLAPKFEMGLICYDRGDTPRAMNYFSEIAQRVPFHADVQYFLGQINMERKAYRDAVNNFNRTMEYGFLDKATRYTVEVRRATAYFKLAEYENAKRSIKNAMALNAQGIEPLLLLSAIQIKEENYRDALKTLERANAVKPNSRGILFQLGSIYYRLNDARYVPYFERLFDIVSAKRATVPRKYAKAMEVLAKKYYDTASYARAARVFASIPEERRDAETLKMSANSYYQIRDYGRAIEYFEKTSLDADSAVALSASYLRTGKADKAKAVVQRYYATAGFAEKARRDSGLARIIGEIESERARAVAEERERQRLIDEQRAKDEAERRAREEARVKELQRRQEKAPREGAGDDQDKKTR